MLLIVGNEKLPGRTCDYELISVKRPLCPLAHKAHCLRNETKFHHNTDQTARDLVQIITVSSYRLGSDIFMATRRAQQPGLHGVFHQAFGTCHLVSFDIYVGSLGA